MKKYSKKIEKLYNDYTKKYCRKDQTFSMNTIKNLVKDIEEYNIGHTEEEVETIAKYLYEKYLEEMSKWKEEVERRIKEGWYW